MREEVIAKILEEKIIAIVRGVGAEECMKVAQALYEGGIRLMEITFDQKNPASFQATAGAIRAIGEAYAGKMMVGAGTVTTTELVELADNVTVFSELKAGRIDAFVVDEVVGRYLISKDAEQAK